jgi:hypothetical protein
MLLRPAQRHISAATKAHRDSYKSRTRGGIVTIVNLDGVKPGGIVIDGPTLAQIFLGPATNRGR